MFTVRVERAFNATHALRYSNGHVEPLHGHDWRVVLTVAANALDHDGLVVDFHAVEATLDTLLAPMQHAHLNNLPAFTQRNPSAEHVAQHIAQAIAPTLPGHARLLSVEVTEAPGCVAAFLPDH